MASLKDRILWIVLSSFFVFYNCTNQDFKDISIQGNAWTKTPKVLHTTVISEIIKRYENDIQLF